MFCNLLIAEGAAVGCRDASCGIMGFANSEGLLPRVVSHTWEHTLEGPRDIRAVSTTSGTFAGIMAQGSAALEILNCSLYCWYQTSYDNL